MHSPASPRQGYAYLWTLCLIGIFATLAAAAAPYLSELNDVSHVNATAETLRGLAAGVDSFNLYAKRGGPSFTTPALLSDLTTEIVAGDQAGCTALTYNSTAVSNWDAHAPFTDFYVPVGGLWTPLGRVNDAPSSTASAASVPRATNGDPYFIQIPNVDVALARMLDMALDSAADPNGGALFYTTPAADSTVLVSYEVTLAHSPAC
jgi:hypothetical protein